MDSSTSKSPSKKWLILIIGSILLICLGFYAYQKLTHILSTEPLPNAQLIAPTIALHKHDLQTQDSIYEEGLSDIDTMVSELSSRLQRQFSENIHLLAVQVSLRNLRDDLSRTYPDQGEAIFRRILAKAFPDLVDAILGVIALMDEYDEWLQSMLLNLNDMNPLEQQGVLWEKRRSLFGDAATQIWQEEITAEQERQLTMRNTMEILDKAYDTSMHERLYLLQSTFEETYADKIQTMLIDPAGILSQVFFGFDSVQKELASLTSEERQTQIDAIRRTMGFPEAQIEYLSKADKKREERWQNGYAYMQARKAAQNQYSGDALNQELDKIREKFFAHEADTIKKEEEELAFYRYERPRVYGRN